MAYFYIYKHFDASDLTLRYYSIAEKLFVDNI